MVEETRQVETGIHDLANAGAMIMGQDILMRQSIGSQYHEIGYNSPSVSPRGYKVFFHMLWRRIQGIPMVLEDGNKIETKEKKRKRGEKDNPTAGESRADKKQRAWGGRLIR
jgi:hypothetical protein